MLKRTVRTAAVIAALTALGACSPSKPDAAPTPSVSATPTPTSRQTSTGPLGEADALPGLRTMSKIGPTTGSQIVGRIQSKQDALWLTVICRGLGSLVVALEPIYRTTVPCSDGGKSNVHQIQLDKPSQLKIAVTATGDVEWSLRVQQ